MSPVARPFWSLVDKSGDCWLWTACKTSNGYGRWRHNLTAHRASYEMAFGPIPPGMMVCHRCDVRTCVNPAHLFLGTAADNNADCRAKGRYTNTFPRGENHPHARLSDADVSAVRAAHKAGQSQSAIARQYGVSPSNIGLIVRGLSRAEVQL